MFARGAVELLNSMASAKNNCAQAEYHLSLKRYQELIGQTDEKPARQDDVASVFSLVNPHLDLTPLAEYVIPPFQDCGRHYYKRNGGN